MCVSVSRGLSGRGDRKCMNFDRKEKMNGLKKKKKMVGGSEKGE